MIFETDFTTEVKKLLDEQEKKLTKGMTEKELKAYKFGVSTFIDLFQQLYSQQEDMFVYNKNTKIGMEILPKDLIKHLKNMEKQ